MKTSDRSDNAKDNGQKVYINLQKSAPSGGEEEERKQNNSPKTPPHAVCDPKPTEIDENTWEFDCPPWLWQLIIGGFILAFLSSITIDIITWLFYTP